MAHFARIEDGIVREVVVVDNEDCGGGIYPESNPIGQAYLNGHCNLDGHWEQTSYSGSFRGCYAGIGYSFDPIADVFLSPLIEEPAP